MVADDFFRLLESHHQRLGTLAGSDVETVEDEIVGVDADMRVLEGAQPVEATLAGEKPVDGNAGEAFRPRQQVGIVLGARQCPVKAGHQRLDRILRRVEQEIGLGDVVRRLAVAVDRLR